MRHLCTALFLLLIGCNAGPADPRSVLEAWAHAGQEGERRVLTDQVRRFNAGQRDFRVALNFIPERSYNAQVQAAAVAGDLPDLLELDGPYLAGYVWQGHLLALEPHLPADLIEDLLPSIRVQGQSGGHLYGVGVFDSALGLYARRSRLQAAGARIPTEPAEAWSAAEFEALLSRLAGSDPDGAVLDLKLNYTPEWYTYAFSPLLYSAGAALIELGARPHAAGVIDSPHAAAAMGRVQHWIRGGRVDPNLDDAAFTGDRVALSWAGHWEYRRYREAAGDDLIVLPLPDFGNGSRSGQGSWLWAITRRARQPQRAAAFIRFLLRPEEILQMTAANQAVPATHSALARSPLYGPGAPLHLFARQLVEGYTVPRPPTPAYPVISSAFQQAFYAIWDGATPAQALGEAAALIDRDLADNRGYPMVRRDRP